MTTATTLITAYTLGDIAQRLDCCPGDVLAALVVFHCGPYWHEGKRIGGRPELAEYLKGEHWFDPVRDIEVNLTFEDEERLAGELGVEAWEFWEERS